MSKDSLQARAKQYFLSRSDYEEQLEKMKHLLVVSNYYGVSQQLSNDILDLNNTMQWVANNAKLPKSYESILKVENFPEKEFIDQLIERRTLLSVAIVDSLYNAIPAKDVMKNIGGVTSPPRTYRGGERSRGDVKLMYPATPTKPMVSSAAPLLLPAAAASTSAAPLTLPPVTPGSVTSLPMYTPAVVVPTVFPVSSAAGSAIPLSAPPMYMPTQPISLYSSMGLGGTGLTPRDISYQYMSADQPQAGFLPQIPQAPPGLGTPSPSSAPGSPFDIAV